MKKTDEKQSKIDVKIDATVVNSVRPREGWGEAFGEMAGSDDDQLLDDVPLSLSTWDETEWEW